MLAEFADFSDAKRYLDKNAVLCKEGDVSKSIFFIVKGSFYQSYYNPIREEHIITDLHMENEWVFNPESLVNQKPAKITIKAFYSASTSVWSMMSKCSPDDDYVIAPALFSLSLAVVKPPFSRSLMNISIISICFFVFCKKDL